MARAVKYAISTIRSSFQTSFFFVNRLKNRRVYVRHGESEKREDFVSWTLYRNLTQHSFRTPIVWYKVFSRTDVKALSGKFTRTFVLLLFNFFFLVIFTFTLSYFRRSRYIYLMIFVSSKRLKRTSCETTDASSGFRSSGFLPRAPQATRYMYTTIAAVHVDGFHNDVHPVGVHTFIANLRNIRRIVRWRAIVRFDIFIVFFFFL